MQIHTGFPSSEWDKIAGFMEVHHDSWVFDAETGCWSLVGEAPWMTWGLAYDHASDVYVGYDFMIAEDVPAAFFVNIAQPVSEIWTRRGGGPWESAWLPEMLGRNGPSMAYDAGSDRVVLFGGCYGTYGHCLDETWTYDADNDAWTLMAPATAPPGRDFAGMTYDASLDRIVLFGGVSINEERTGRHLGDTWLYDVDADIWERVETAASPSPRAYPQLAYVPSLGRTYLYGGEGESGALGDLWYLDSATGAWMAAPGDAPAPRYRHGMGYDSAAGALVVFGGGDSLDCPFWDETIVYDPFAAAWHHPDRRAPGEDPHPEDGLLCVWPIG